MELVLQRLRDAGELAQRAGPYVLMEILLPGGTLFALLVFLYRRRMARDGHAGPVLGWLIGRAEDTLHLRIAGTRRPGHDGLEPLGFGAD